MNDDRRKRIGEIRNALEDLSSQIDELASEERDAFDNMPEGLRDGENGQKAEAAADALDEAINDIEAAVSNLETAGE